MCAEQTKVFHGEIADNQCAMNVHSLSRSHKEMLKGKTMGNTAQSCSRMCVRRFGGHYVLQDGDKVFNLDDQQRADTYAGVRVKITGTPQAQNTIHVISIEPEK
jgi:hypothetical protein